ncbi:MAG: C-terminal binding protein [Gammaproteobacteria bacterium]|nr:C-terminal binding protein [Gammaproteobacteria bacterium]
MKIVRTDRELECPQVDEALLATGAELVLLAESVSESELVEAVRDADLLLMCYTAITAEVINSATRLKAIIKYGVGIDAIDIEAAKTRRIPIVNIPEYAEETVAEGAFSLMIALAKKLIPVHNTMQQDGWAWPTAIWMGGDLAGKTLGLIGVGRIGRSMARMAGSGFRMQVLGYSPHTSTEDMHNFGVARIEDLRDMLVQCDFVSVHCVLNEETRDLIGKAEFSSMKSSAFLINTSRGAVVNEQELLNALKTGQIAGAGLDVFSQEPVTQSGHLLSELYQMENVILMPHLTFYTRESMARLEAETLQRCFEALNGKPLQISSQDPRLLSQQHGVSFVSSI